MKRLRIALVALAALGAGNLAQADALDALKAFSRDVKTGSATFTQTVTSPDGRKTKVSSGEFEFARPDRFRFAYLKPYQQLIVADGRKVWIHDPDLNQVSSRKLDGALGATPAALLSGGALDQDFELEAQGERDGLAWVKATPRQKDGAFQSVQVGFRGSALAAIDITDSFGQRSLLQFADVQANPPLAAERFRFVPPAGAEVLEQ